MTILKVGQWIAGKLLLMDLAYRKGLLLKRIADLGGYFLLRKKQSDDLVVTANPWCGKPLSALVPEFIGKSIDVMAELPWHFDRGPHKHKRHVMAVRVVGHWYAQEGQHRFYITNAPAELIVTEQVGPIYTARWEIELFFRELKLTHRIEQLPTRKQFVSESLIYGALLSLLLSRKLHQQLLPRALPAPERWARIFANFALDILNVAFGAARHSRLEQLRLARTLRREAPDPNVKRRNLLARANFGRFSSA